MLFIAAVLPGSTDMRRSYVKFAFIHRPESNAGTCSDVRRRIF